MPYRIGLIGSAGLGKSGVAEQVGKKLDIVFIKSKDITRPVLTAYGYDVKKGDYVEKFLSEKELESEIVAKKMNQERWMSDGFVTDRTTLECFAYALLSVEKYSKEEIEELERKCRENMANYTHLFYFPQRNGWLEDNGLRTVNVFFQWKIDMIIRGLLHDWGIPFTTIETDNPAKEILAHVAG